MLRRLAHLLRAYFPPLEEPDDAAPRRQRQHHEFRRFFRVGLRMVGFLIVLLVLWEGLLRVIPGEPQESYIQHDPLLGSLHVPNATFDFRAREGCPGWAQTVQFNSHGLRSAEFPVEKAADEYRILVMGDSYTITMQYPLAGTWPSILEDTLNAASDDTRYTVINAAHNAMSPAQQMLYYQERGRHFQPDIVLILTTAATYIYSSPELRPYPHPYFKRVDDDLVLDLSYVQAHEEPAWVTQLRATSQAFDRMWRLYRRYEELDHAAAIDAERAARLLNRDTSATTATPEEWEAVDLTGRIYRELDRAAAADGATLVLAHYTGAQHLADLYGTPDDGQEMARIFHTALGEYAAAAGIAYYDSVPFFRDYVRRTGEHITGCAENGWSGHWNATANRLFGEEMARYLVDHALIP